VSLGLTWLTSALRLFALGHIKLLLLRDRLASVAHLLVIEPRTTASKSVTEVVSDGRSLLIIIVVVRLRGAGAAFG
jgi:hypothetical protein